MLEPVSHVSPRRFARARSLALAGVLLGCVVPVQVAAAATPVANGRGTKARGVKYARGTVVIPGSVVTSHLKRVSADGATYTFNSSRGPLAKLKRGSIMLLQGYAVRTVTGVAKRSGGIVVGTTPAGITDLLRSGTLSWNTPIDFRRGYALGGSAVPLAAADRAGRSAVPARFGLRAVTSRAFRSRARPAATTSRPRSSRSARP